jgi:outer membrane protein OmpA-like peptidoglycan-associated protein
MEPLDALANTLRQCPALQVMIEGHTDSDGDYYRNQSLSVRRALAVREHLVNAGAAPLQLSIIGFGQIRPLAPNDSATNKSRNRRIELVLQ